MRNSIDFKRRTDLEDDNIEMLAISINKPNSKAFLIISWYRPPQSTVENSDTLENCINKAESQFNGIYIIGDLNCDTSNDSPEFYTTRLNKFMQSHQLSQLIEEPTRTTKESSTTIDLFITNCEEGIGDQGYINYH